LQYSIAILLGAVALAGAFAVGRNIPAHAQAGEDCIGVRLCESSSAIPVLARQPLPVEIDTTRAPLPFKLVVPPLESLVLEEVHLTLPSGQVFVQVPLNLQAPISVQGVSGNATSAGFLQSAPQVFLCPAGPSVCVASQISPQSFAGGVWNYHVSFGPLYLYPGAVARMVRGSVTVGGQLEATLPVIGVAGS
jgi:hypothetical protein